MTRSSAGGQTDPASRLLRKLVVDGRAGVLGGSLFRSNLEDDRRVSVDGDREEYVEEEQRQKRHGLLQRKA